MNPKYLYNQKRYYNLSKAKGYCLKALASDGVECYDRLMDYLEHLQKSDLRDLISFFAEYLDKGELMEIFDRVLIYLLETNQKRYLRRKKSILKRLREDVKLGM